mgnify:CR=1 FL=1
MQHIVTILIAILIFVSSLSSMNSGILSLRN